MKHRNRELLSRVLRANPAYELVLYDRLEPGVRVTGTPDDLNCAYYSFGDAGLAPVFFAPLPGLISTSVAVIV